MLLTGIILGPFALDTIAPEILNISAELRELSLVVILTRAGLSLDIADLKKVGRSAILMCFVPALCEIAVVTLLAPMIFGISRVDAAIMGAVLGAVSPAVIVPKMLSIMETGYGKAKSIPQLILAGASVDDIFVIVLFAAFMGMHDGNAFDTASLIKIPISILIGGAVGVLFGVGLNQLFRRIHLRDTVKVLILLSASVLLVALESAIKHFIPLSGLLAVMALGCTILKTNPPVATRLSTKFSKIWVAAEVMLFVLVGAAVDISYAMNAGLFAILLIFMALCLRLCGVFVCLLGSPLNLKERLFCAISYLPKATVQAAIGGLPLAAGISSGNVILTVAVLAILITAPLGALLIDLSHKRLLVK
jgi:NhaP-type Na+/H+ or K+/H+ antiporter